MAGKVVVELGGRLGNVLFSTANCLYYHSRYSSDEMYYHYSDPLWERYYPTYSRFHFFKEWTQGFENLTELNPGYRSSFRELPDCDGDVLRLPPRGIGGVPAAAGRRLFGAGKQDAGEVSRA